MKKIGICITTFKRKNGLTQLLESIKGITFKEECMVIVVDNDINKSAQDVIKKNIITDDFMAIKYQVEPNQGISNARNLCIKIAREEQCTHIVFIDDDEKIIRDDWLINMMNTMEKFNGDIVVGPVISDYSPDYIPQWLRESKFFERPRFITGTFLPGANSGNTLIKLDILNKYDLPFPEQFGLSGGEDTYLFMRLRLEGRKIIWCDEAEVVEHVPKGRTSIPWILKRSFTNGSNFSRIEYTNKKSSIVIISRFLKGIIHILSGALKTLININNKGKMVKSLSLMFTGFGEVSGVFGKVVYQYKRDN